MKIKTVGEGIKRGRDKKMNDWIFKDDCGICHFRVAAVIIHQNKLLTQFETETGFYALPGGHIRFGETSSDALVREINEETGLNVTCGRLLWVEENFWKWSGRKAHGIHFYYLVEFKNGCSVEDVDGKPIKDNDMVTLRLVELDKIKELPIFPLFLKEKIFNLSDNVEHFINNSWREA